MPQDRYEDIEQLSLYREEGRDFAVHTDRRISRFAVVAPHGGGIEAGTSEVARAIAGAEHSLYLFEGLKPGGNEALHITSANFDEPRCQELLLGVDTVVTIHGARGDSPIVHLGGLDARLIRRMASELNAAGFVTCQTSNPAIAGKLGRNICNRGTSGRGCQLEISLGLRLAMFRSLNQTGRKHPTPTFHRFIEAGRRALTVSRDGSA
jgi:phage replication-related protein YjqB (UPF0714/DUF867 family)